MVLTSSARAADVGSALNWVAGTAFSCWSTYQTLRAMDIVPPAEDVARAIRQNVEAVNQMKALGMSPSEINEAVSRFRGNGVVNMVAHQLRVPYILRPNMSKSVARYIALRRRGIAHADALVDSTTVLADDIKKLTTARVPLERAVEVASEVDADDVLKLANAGYRDTVEAEEALRVWSPTDYIKLRQARVPHATAIKLGDYAVKDIIKLNFAVTDLTPEQMIKVLGELNLDEYISLRQFGLPHPVVEELLPNYKKSEILTLWSRHNNLTTEQMSKVLDTKVNDYLQSRDMGLMHDDAVEVAESYSIKEARKVRNSGASSAEVMEVLRNGDANVDDYVTARNLRATHNEALEASTWGEMKNYQRLRNARVTHAEAKEAIDDFDVDQYLKARNRGLNHQQFKDAQDD